MEPKVTINSVTTVTTEITLQLSEIQAAGIIMLIGDDDAFQNTMERLEGFAGWEARTIVEEELLAVWQALGPTDSGVRGVIALQGAGVLPKMN